MARVSFEGVYFPVDEVLAALARHLRPEHQGKLDVLDLENWRLTRHLFDQGRIRSSSAPLNNVLDYSGHLIHLEHFNFENVEISGGRVSDARA